MHPKELNTHKVAPAVCAPLLQGKIHLSTTNNKHLTKTQFTVQLMHPTIQTASAKIAIMNNTITIRLGAHVRNVCSKKHRQHYHPIDEVPGT